MIPFIGLVTCIDYVYNFIYIVILDHSLPSLVAAAAGEGGGSNTTKINVGI